MTLIFHRLALPLVLAALVAAQMLHIAVPRHIYNRRVVDPPPLQPTRTTQHKNSLHSRQQGGTNAQRFAAGLPPLKPKNLLSPTRVRRSGSSASPSASAGLAARSRRATTRMTTGFLQVIDIRTQRSLGYLSRSLTADGQYLVSRDLGAVLEVTFDPEPVGLVSHLKVTIQQDEDHPFLGLIAATVNGRTANELSADGHMGACLGMTNDSNHGRRGHIEGSESSIWMINDSSAMPVWINTDGLETHATLVYSQTNGTVCLISGARESDGPSVKLRLVRSS